MSPSSRPPVNPYVVLAVAVAAISFGGPLVRLSNSAPVAIAMGRIAFSLIVVGAALAIRGEWRDWRSLTGRDLAVAIGAGVMLAIHFWTWNASIGMTTVAASVLLVNLQPAFVAVWSSWFLRERPAPAQWAGIAIAIGGAMIVVFPDLGAGFQGGRALAGDALAVVGAISGSLYVVAGRRLRAKIGVWAYVGVVYGVCLLSLIAIAASTGVPLSGYPRRELLIFAALALGPMLLGHTGTNWALGYLPAYIVNVTLLAEPVGATVLAALLPGIREAPSPSAIVGGLVVLLGIWRATAPVRGADPARPA